MDVGKECDKEDIISRNLLFGIVTYAKGMIGKGPVRSQGHSHIISPSCGYSTPEVYEIWEGEAIVYMQESGSDDAGNCYAVYAKAGDILIYADLARWEAQLRYRAGATNWKINNPDEDILKKYKRGYFLEWRISDKLKDQLHNSIDYLLDTNRKNDPAMVSGKDYRHGLSEVVTQPFRGVPYFDASVWGGTWMEENFGLEHIGKNYGWAFDGVPEENSLYLRYGDVKIEVPSINLVHQYPDELLGAKVHSRFGKEFPIRFDYLDTMNGGNLSLQVHPLTEYIQEKFGMHYTQDESYYILDAKEGASVYLGVKENTDLNKMVTNLKKAQDGDYIFPDKQNNKMGQRKSGQQRTGNQRNKGPQRRTHRIT